MESNILDKIDVAVAEYEAKKALLTQELASGLANLWMVVFNTYPNLKSFSWSQYTPYFNDGDSCEFYVNDIDEANEEYCCGYGMGELDPAVKDANVILNRIPDDFLLYMYGDHMKITIHRDGRVVEEDYDHE